MTVSISPTKDFITSCSVNRFWTNGRILMFKVSKQPFEVPDMIGSFVSGATTSIVAKNWTNNLSQPFKELQGSNSEFKLITSKSITQKILGLFWDNFRTILEPFWDHIGTILGPFWDYFGNILGPFLDHFGTPLGPFWAHFRNTLERFWDLF